MFKARALGSGLGECYAKLKYDGNKFKTDDVQPTVLGDCEWNSTFKIRLNAGDQPGDLLLEIFERRSMKSNCLVGRAHLKDSVDEDGEQWLHLKGDDGNECGAEVHIMRGTMTNGGGGLKIRCAPIDISCKPVESTQLCHSPDTPTMLPSMGQAMNI